MVGDGIFMLGGWWGMEWQEKFRVQNEVTARVKPKNQLGRAVLAP